MQAWSPDYPHVCDTVLPALIPLGTLFKGPQKMGPIQEGIIGAREIIGLIACKHTVLLQRVIDDVLYYYWY